MAEGSEVPELSLGVFDAGSGKVLLSETIKNKWLHDNVRKDEWQKVITEFEKVLLVWIAHYVFFSAL